MRLLPQSFNGFLFQQGSKVASDFSSPYDWNIQGVSANDIPRSQNFPLFTSKMYLGSTKVVNVTLNDVDTSRDDLVASMDLLGENQHPLVSTDEFGRAWYVDAVFIGLTEDGNSASTASFGAVFAVDDPIWKKLTPSTQRITVSGTGMGTIIPLGNQPALPTITVTPFSSGGFGFLHKRFITIINNSANAFIDSPLDITDGGLDTSVLDMLPNGDDLRIYIDGVEVKRWFGGGGINSASTLIWVNWTQPANSNMTLGVGIAGAGDVSTITIEDTAMNAINMALIPDAGNVIIGTEIFVYASVDRSNKELMGITRSERQTSPGAHSAGDVVQFVTHDVWMYYGYPTIAPYVVDDTYKPVFDLATSTNTSHVYNGIFKDAAGNRTGAWQESIVLLTSNYPNSHNYTGTQDTVADPASVIGTYIEGKSIMGWKLYEPCGITHVSASGLAWSAIPRFSLVLESGASGLAYTNNVVIFNAPSPLATFVAIDTGGTVALGVTHSYLRFRSFGEPVNQQYSEWSDVTVTLDSTYAPTISIAAEGAGFITLHSIIANSATTETLELQLALAINTYVVVDTENKTVTLYDGTNQIGALLNMPVRNFWFQLLPRKNNVITITDAGDVYFDFAWKDRSL
jgi:hypothetical protein